MAAANDSDVVKILLQLAMASDLSKDEIERLRNEAAKRSGMTKRMRDEFHRYRAIGEAIAAERDVDTWLN